MAPRRRQRPARQDMDQLDLLLDFQPSNPVVAFDDRMVRGASIAVTISKAISQSLQGRDRETVARDMSRYLDEQVSKHMLDAYASQAKHEHIISVVRFIGLIHATGDRRLLELLAEGFGWAVIERRYLPAIAMAERIEARAELDREIDADRRQLKKSGLLR